MGETNEGRRIGIENLSLDNFPRDLLQRFMSSSATSTSAREEVEEEDSEDLELNLGLSLGGRFGIDKSKKIKLVRSSSIIGTVPFNRSASSTGDDLASPAPAVSFPALMRTASLPVETEEEWRKRKEIQTLRRMAAKRRRSEKQRIGKAPEKEDDAPVTISRQNSVVGGGIDLEAAVAVAVAARGRQGSAESVGGSSSGMSELESRVGRQGSRSPGGGSQSQPSGERSQEGENSSNTKWAGPETSPSGERGNKGREIGTSAVEEMPSVFAKGEGPNGRRVDGILYRYGKGAQVRIMCVCHGKFLSPADFVKHAGGGDVDNPLRHIVINPSPSPLL